MATASMMSAEATESVVKSLSELQRRELSIVALGEPIASATQAPSQEPCQRASDASNASLDAPTPIRLEADLAHYKELFAKLRFSYVEQVTKEKFLRAIVGDPPLIVTPQENLNLEQENVTAKMGLKARKTEVEGIVAELEQQGRELSRRYEEVRTQTARLRELPGEVAAIEQSIAQLKAELQAPSDDPTLNLPLAKTQELVARKMREQHDLDRELERLQAQIPRKQKEHARLQAELQPLEAKRQNISAAAIEARRRKDKALGGVEDDLEEKGRWWRANEAVLKQALDL